MIETLKNIDQYIFLLINGCNSPFWDSVMWFVSGKLSWLPLYIVFLFYLIKKEKQRKWVAIVSVVVLIALSDQISVKLFKEVFLRYRPCHNGYIKNIVHLVNGYCGGQYGFVSSHAANYFALATFLLLVFKNAKVGAALLLWATVIGYSRIYLGVHYPADVIGGALLGLVLGGCVYWAYNKSANLL